MEFKTVCRCLLILIVLMVCVSCVTSAKKKCSRAFRRIPVQKKFKLNKFLGTWYTVTRTSYMWSNNTYESASIEFRENSDGSYSYFSTGKLGDTCTPVESGTLVPARRKGQFVLRAAEKPQTNVATLIVSFTDYQNIAMVYYCFKYRPGRRNQCHAKGRQVEIITRSTLPKKNQIKGYIKRAARRLCAPPKDMHRTKPGLCKIPDILKEARRKVPDLKAAEEKSKHSVNCAVNNIPVQKNFSLSNMEGLWYEIARTRYTFNKMESVVSYHRYDEYSDHINSYYTGTVTDPSSDEPATCMTAIAGMSKTKEKADEPADMIGRIGGEDSKYPWSPMKMLYADDQYQMFYACYAGASDSPCYKGAMEVTLVGRSRDIDPDKRKIIYSKLKNVCVDPSDMIDTQVIANCSQWVQVDTEGSGIEPDDCSLDSIQVYEDFTNSQVVGTWYLFAAINYNENNSYHGVTLQKTIASPSELIRTEMHAIPPGDTQQCAVYHLDSRDRCLNTGDHLTTLPVGGYGSFVFSKTLYLSNVLLVEYICNKLNIEGTCDTDGIFFNVYTRNSSGLPVYTESTENSDDGDSDDSDTIDYAELISKLAKSVCLDPAKLTYETEWCSYNETVADAVASNTGDADDTDDEDVPDRQCDIDNLSIFSDVDEYTQEGLFGYWYEIASSEGSDDFGNRESLVAYFTSDNNQTLQVYYAGYKSGNDNCSAVGHETMISRCSLDPNGDYLVKLRETDNYVSYVPFKILHTDYTNVLVTYTCHEILPNGQCCDKGAHVRIWGRNTTLPDMVRDYANEMVFWACLDPYKDGFMVEKSEHYSDECFNGLQLYVNETLAIETSDDEIDIESDEDEEDDDDPFEQRDEEIDDDFIDDLEAALLMDDDDFYSDS